jgi:uncharacterized protein YegL
MGAAIRRGIELVNERKQVYRTNGVKYFRPWIFLITDGGPTDDKDVWQAAVEMVKQGESSKAFSFWAVGVQGARMDVLTQLGVAHPPMPLNGLKFRELFVWLSGSLGTLSHSRPGEEDSLTLSNPSDLMKWLKM